MALVRLLGIKPLGKPGEIERHFGYDCQVSEDGGLIAEIPDGLAQVEVAAGRVAALGPAAPADQPEDSEAPPPEAPAGAGKGKK